MRSLTSFGIGGAAVAVAMLVGGYQIGRLGTFGSAVSQAHAQETPLTEQRIRDIVRETMAAQQPVAAGGQMDQARVEQIVRDYLVKNPEIIQEMQVALEVKQREEQRLAALGTIKSQAGPIFNASTDAVLGNPKGKTTIVEFYDYNCGFCKRALGDMEALTKADPDLRFVLKELPILGPDSQKAHVVSQAFHRLMPEKYGEFHLKLLGSEARATEDTALLLAQSLGANLDQLKTEMAKPDVMTTLIGNRELAEQLQINGTPSYVVGDEVVFGAMGQEALAAKIAEARASCQTSAC